MWCRIVNVYFAYLLLYRCFLNIIRISLYIPVGVALLGCFASHTRLNLVLMPH
jgi:hypothetical protein